MVKSKFEKDLDEELAEMKANHEPIMIAVTEIDMKDEYKHVRHIRFPLDDGKWPICYRSRTSYNAFANSTKERCYKPNKKNAETLFHCQREADFQISHDCWKSSLEKYDKEYKDPEFIDVDNIWEFYKLIGYDYKKKKYKI
jgi:hypothetical protein